MQDIVDKRTAQLRPGGAGVARATMQEDLAARSPHIHWPGDFRPENAHLFSHNELFIEAPVAKIWNHLVDAELWPGWYPNCASVRLLDGADRLGPEVRWRWKTFGLALESRVNEYVAQSRLAWYGYSPGFEPVFYQAWLLQPEGAGCVVVTEDAGFGMVASGLREADEGLLHRGHALWLATLKWKAEGR
jgi:uncharacterized protein YndB with AHSA1/START domain